MVSRLSGDQIFTFSRRLERNGQFAGVAVISFSADILADVWASLEFDRNSAVLLFRDDGRLIARYPMLENADEYSRPRVLRRISVGQSDSGTMRIVSPLDGVERVISYRPVPGSGIVAASAIRPGNRPRSRLAGHHADPGPVHAGDRRRSPSPCGGSPISSIVTRRPSSSYSKASSTTRCWSATPTIA
jgi:hypothetical protein